MGVGAVVWNKNKILIVKRAHPPQQGFWSLPGGLQRLGETIFEAAVREVFEETSIRIKPITVITALDCIVPDEKNKAKFKYHYTLVEVVADYLEGIATARDDASDVKWATIDEIERICSWNEVSRVAKLSLLQKNKKD